jgi:hypothetical protein
VKRHMALIAASSLAVAVTLVPAVTSAAQVSPLPMPSQQPTVTPARPVIGGHHVQPRATQLQSQGVQAPTSQQTREMDRLTRELLDASKTKSGTDD